MVYTTLPLSVTTLPCINSRGTFFFVFSSFQGLAFVYCLWPLPRLLLLSVYYCSMCTTLPCTTTINSRSSSSSLPAITATSYYLSNTRVLFVATTIRVSEAPHHVLFVVVLFVCPTIVLMCIYCFCSVSYFTTMSNHFTIYKIVGVPNFFSRFGSFNI